MASLFDLLFDNRTNYNNGYYRKPQYVEKPNYRNNYYYNNSDNYYDDVYSNIYNNRYSNNLYENNRSNFNNNYHNFKNNNKSQYQNQDNNNQNNKNNKNQYNQINNSSQKIKDFNIKETSDSIIIETELPNVNKKDIEIQIKDSILIIQGESKKPQQENMVQEEQEVELPSIEEYEEDRPEDKNRVVYKYITVKVQPKKVQKQIQDKQFGPFKKQLDLSEILPFLNLRNINSTFENGLLSIKISKINNSNFRVRII